MTTEQLNGVGGNLDKVIALYYIHGVIIYSVLIICFNSISSLSTMLSKYRAGVTYLVFQNPWQPGCFVFLN